MSAGGAETESPGSEAEAATDRARAKRTLNQRLRGFALLSRFPKLSRYPPVDEPWPSDWPVVERPGDYATLAEELAVWAKVGEQRFRPLDHEAQILQNQFWRQHVALILGGLLATSLGAFQATAGGRWKVGAAAIQAVLAGLLAGLTVLVRSRRAQHGYLSARLRAERIKSEFFLFVAQAGEYDGNHPEVRLRQQIDDIEAAEGMP